MDDPPPDLPALAPEGLDAEEAKLLIRLATLGTGPMEIGEAMELWPDCKKAQGWQVLTAYFHAAAEIDPQAERGKAIARIQFLYAQSCKIQDWKTALACQRELTKLLDRYEQ